MHPQCVKKLTETTTHTADPDVTFEEVDLEEPTEVETVHDEDEDPVTTANGENPNIDPAPIQFHSDKTGKLIPVDDDKLLNRHYLLPFEEDGSRYRAKIIGIERDFNDPKYSSDEFIRFRVQVNDEEFDEHVAYNKIVSFIDEHFQQSEKEGYWTMRRILAHDHLHPDDPRLYDKAGNARFKKNCKYIVLIEWEDGQRSWEDPRLFDGDLHEITVAVNARD